MPSIMAHYKSGKFRRWLEVRRQAGGAWEYRCKLCFERPTARRGGSKWHDWRVCVNRMKLERCKEHDEFNHGDQPSFNESMYRLATKRQERSAVAKVEEDKLVVPLIDAAFEASALELAASNIAPLAHLLRRNGVEVTKSWCSKNYEFVWWRCAADVQKEVIKTDLIGVQCFGLTVDETTDVGVEKQLIVYLKIDSTKRQKFLGLVTMTGSTADDIVKAIQVVLLDFGLDIQKMVSFSSDGCNTMRGTENGVLIKLTRLINISTHPQRPDDVDDKSLFAPHCVLHRLNLSLNDIFLFERTPVTVCQLADRIELIVKYCHSWFARSSERRLEYKNLIKEHTVVEIPASWNETRWLSRYRALKATCDSNSAILQFIEENAKVKQSPEGLFVAKWMSDPDFMTEMKMVRSVVKVMFKLSIILQASVQSPWEAFLLIQIGVGRLTELLDEVEETKSAEAVRLLIRTMRKSINERIPQSEAKMLAIFDFRILKHMVDKARIAQESAAGIHPRGEQDDFKTPRMLFLTKAW